MLGILFFIFASCEPLTLEYANIMNKRLMHYLKTRDKPYDYCRLVLEQPVKKFLIIVEFTHHMQVPHSGDVDELGILIQSIGDRIIRRLAVYRYYAGKFLTLYCGF